MGAMITNTTMKRPDLEDVENSNGAKRTFDITAGTARTGRSGIMTFIWTPINSRDATEWECDSCFCPVLEVLFRTELTIDYFHFF